MIRFKDFVVVRLRAIEAKLDTIISLLGAAAVKETSMKADLSDVLKAVGEQNTVNKSIEALVDGLAGQLQTMPAAPTVAPADRAPPPSSTRANNAETQAKVPPNTPAPPPVVTPPVVNPPVVNPAPPPPPAGV